jgi:hypothetical protein
MDQPKFKAYVERLCRLRSAFCVPDDDDLPVSDTPVDLTARDAEWQPGFGPGEQEAKEELIQDDTSFKLFDVARPVTLMGEPSRQTWIKFSSVSPGVEHSLKTLNVTTQQAIDLTCDLQRRVFIKHVRCANPLRTGPDKLAMSVIDLVGRRLEWESFKPRDTTWELKSVAFLFAYDQGISRERVIHIDRGKRNVMLTADNVGLATLLE